MAGAGSRLRENGADPLKPLMPIRGQPLVSYTIDALVQAGVRSIHAVIGFEGDALMERLPALVPPEVALHFTRNPHWRKQNGISVLAVADKICAPFFLTMSDHVFDPLILDLLLRESVLDKLNLAIDRKLDSIFDHDDAMKVQTRGDRIVAIGKRLPKYDAIDTGLFVCPLEIFPYLERAKTNGDCALADGVRLMATENKVRGIDIGAAWWQDVDTPEMFRHAESEWQFYRRGASP
jgi:choline kinase